MHLRWEINKLAAKISIPTITHKNLELLEYEEYDQKHATLASTGKIKIFFYFLLNL